MLAINNAALCLNATAPALRSGSPIRHSREGVHALISRANRDIASTRRPHFVFPAKTVPRRGGNPGEVEGHCFQATGTILDPFRDARRKPG